MSLLNKFAPDEIYAKLEKHPINAPGINHIFLIADFRHIVPDTIPVIRIPIYAIFENSPDMNTATTAENTPDIVEKKALDIPSSPCFPDAKYAVQPANPIHVTKLSAGI